MLRFTYLKTLPYLFRTRLHRTVSTKQNVEILKTTDEEAIMKENWKQRCDLATAYRALERYNMHEGVCNHLTVKAPSLYQDEPIVLVIPYGLHWSKVTPESLVGIDSKTAKLVEGCTPPDNTAHSIHLGIYSNRSDVKSIMHTHAKYATILSCLEDPTIKMLNQNSTRFFYNVAYDIGFEMAADSTTNNEGDRIGKALGDKSVLLMGNHGLTTVGETVAMAFDLHYYFERVSEFQILAYQTGKSISYMSDETASFVEDQWKGSLDVMSKAHLYGIQDALNKEDPNFINDNNFDYIKYTQS